MSENSRIGLWCLAGIFGEIFLLFSVIFCFGKMGTSDSPGFWFILYLIIFFIGMVPVYGICMGCLSE